MITHLFNRGNYKFLTNLGCLAAVIAYTTKFPQAKGHYKLLYCKATINRDAAYDPASYI